MSCKLTQRFVPGYLDGELDLSRTIEMETHLQGCAECARELEKQQALRATLQRGSLAFAAPEGLRARIQTSLLAATSAPAPILTTTPALASVQANFPARTREWSPFQFLRWASAFAVLALCTVVAWQLLPGLHGPTNDQQLAAEVFTSHVRSLEANHLMDIVSTDQHTVKPWFDGKLDFSPPVEELASDGFPLIGGRLDYLEGHQVAALIYQRRKHIINVYVWPEAAAAVASSAKTLEPRQGYNMIRWAGGGFQFWAISDVSAADLAELARLLENRGGAQTK